MAYITYMISFSSENCQKVYVAFKGMSVQRMNEERYLTREHYKRFHHLLKTLVLSTIQNTYNNNVSLMKEMLMLLSHNSCNLRNNEINLYRYM